MEPAFRPADDGDVEVVIDFMRQLYASERQPFDESFARVALEHLVANETQGGVWMIQRDEETIGYVAVTLGYSLRLHGQVACVDELFVVPAQRKQGVGTAALRFVADMCAERGIEVLCVEIGRSATAARQLAHAAGFTDGGTVMTRWLST
jgi:GNAT superfamily N-acetyltransferase